MSDTFRSTRDVITTPFPVVTFAIHLVSCSTSARLAAKSEGQGVLQRSQINSLKITVRMLTNNR
jgi:hypothetical protein